MSLLEKMRGDRKGWYKVSDLVAGLEIAVPSQNRRGDGNMLWDEIVSIKPVGREHVYDIEVEGTHNFVGNGIFAHNTYVLRANTMLAVTGEVNAGSITVPLSDGVPTFGTTTLMAEIPSAVLTADGKGVDLYKLSTYNLEAVNVLAARMNDDEVRITSLESRVDKLENGEVSSSTTDNIGTGLASAFNAFGAFIQKGIAQFGTLVADQFVAATNSAGTSSAGSVTILAGNTVALVNNAYVLPTSKIFVTLTASTTGSWYISDKQNGSFKIVLSTAQATDVSFDYFLVQTEGQVATSTPEGSYQGSTLNPNSQGQTLNTITLLGDNPVHVSVGGAYVEPGIVVAGGAPYVTFINGIQQEVNATTIDTSSPTTYVITYKATDAAGNTATAMRSVIVGNPDGTVNAGAASGASGGSGAAATTTPADTTPPVVTLVGAAALQINVGDTFSDPGATATDDTDGDLTAKIVETGAVNTTTAGLYTLTYSATDAAGNVGTVSRVVTIIASTTPTP